MASVEVGPMTEKKHNTPAKTRETSGFLMSIVRTLSASADYEQREKEKSRIEKAYRESDKKLVEHVTDNHKDLNKILQGFSGISKRINESREKIRKIKNDLNSCKALLHCKRDELRRLWIDGVEQKTIVVLLDQIEQIKEVPDQLDAFLAKKHYLHATELVVNVVAKLGGPLSGVEALRDLRAELTTRREQLHEILIDELNKQIYILSVTPLPQSFQRIGSGRKIEGVTKQLGDAKRNRGASGRESPVPFQNVEEIEIEQDVKEDLNSDPQENPTKFINIIVESLFVLKKIPEAVETIKLKIQPELAAIIARSSLQVVESVGQQGELSHQNQPRYLLELLQCVFHQFRCVANTHKIVLKNLRKIIVMRGELMYDMKDVWSKIQAVLELLFREYLDVQNTASSRQQAPTSFDAPSTDIGVYFAKKKPAKPKKVSMFRFDASIHALSTNSYVADNRQFELGHLFGAGSILGEMGLGKHQFVCKPAANNITAIFKPLQRFIKEIEVAMDLSPGASSLQAFVTDFVQNIFLGQVHYTVSTSINAATKGFDALRNVIDHKTQKELGVPRPLLQSTVTVDRNIQELRELMFDLPDYADQFLNMICNVLRDYRDTCHSAYRGIVQYDSDEKRVISAMWAKDEDISRFLRSLPSWRSLQPSEGQELNRNVCSEEEMRALNSKEAVILISNLSSADSLIPQQEIITDVTQMRTVANVHESLAWFAGRLKVFSRSLLSSASTSLVVSDQQGSDIPPVSAKTLESLNGLVKDFQDLAEICLLLLHLEVRVHCFYFLMPVAKQSNYAGAIDDLDPDSNVLKLNKDLSAMEEVLSQSLQPKKFKYIFESLGYLVASIIMNSIQFLKKINENGIKKMCRNIFAIQQNLTNITMTRESDLDHARQYYELLYLNPDDILTSISEKGPHFTELEYCQLMQLHQRSHPGVKVSQLEARLCRLKEVIEKGQNEAV
ncbi:hypothetical protein ScPMuIL_001608 [Solemya velum]